MKVDTDTRLHRRPLIIAGILLGLGQGGFFDGIVFHQLLQWHHMFSNIESTKTIAGLELNTIGDGLFHVFDWLMTLMGIIVLWLAVKRDNVVLSTSTFIGSFAIGAGLFNVVEGILSHHLLQIHHVKPGIHQQLWDLGFIGVGVLSIVIGWIILSQDKPASEL